MTRALLDELNRDNQVVIIGGKTRVMRWAEVHHEANRERYVYKIPVYMTFDDFKNYHMNRFTVNRNGDPVSIGGWWLRQPQRLTFKGVIFVPNGPPVIEDHVNLWQGFGVKPVAGSWSRMQDHIYEVLAAKDDRVNKYILNWLAFAVQYPAQQAEVALAFKGGYGTGKGVLGRAMCRIFGPHGLHISETAHLTGKFNAHFQMCCFLFADEALAPQDKRAEGVLKRLITEDTLTIEPKGINAFQVDNHLHVMEASNHGWMAQAGEKERRIVLQEVLENHQQNEGWFAPLYAELREGGLAAMMHGLLDRSLGDWHPRQIVRTKALAEQQMESLDPLDQWWLELLTVGALPGALPDEPWKARANEWEEDISTTALGGFSRVQHVKVAGLYDHARRSSPRLRGVSDTALGRFLGKNGCFKFKIDGGLRGWIFKRLPELRDKWCERFPDTEWPSGVVDWGGLDALDDQRATAQIFDFPE